MARKFMGQARCTLATALSLSLVTTAAFPVFAADTPDSSVQQGAETSRDQNIISPSAASASGETAVFVQFKGTGAYELTRPATGRATREQNAAKRDEVRSIHAWVNERARTAAEATSSKILYTTVNTVRGVGLYGDIEQIRKLAARQDVARISVITNVRPQNAGTAVHTDTLTTWAQKNNTGGYGYTGRNVTVAVIDTGIDYTHADLGGPGTDEAYRRAKDSDTLPDGLYDPQKLVGGYDMAGDSYNASTKEHALPIPDANPLDCSGHGTHVAGTIAGYGVGADNTAFHGDYSALSADALHRMRIAPGAAPEARLVAFRIFGCAGTSALTLKALDRVLDPNDDGDFSDRADIVNLSAGTDYGVFDESTNYAIGELYRQGVLTVTAAGNAASQNGAGDTYSISGGPATSAYALTVANSIGATQSADRVKVLSPAGTSEIYGRYTTKYDYARHREGELTGQVVKAPASNLYGCAPFTAEEAARLKGKWVYLDWDNTSGAVPCGSAVRFANVERAGGAGVVLGTGQPLTDIAGTAALPGVLLPSEQAEKIRPALASGTLTLRLDDALRTGARIETGAADQPNPASARGAHGSWGSIKPDVSAPGTGIASARAGSGAGASTLTGTSMSAAYVCGVAAQLVEEHRSYSPQQLKATLMNTAAHPVHDAHNRPYPPDRVGSGRIDSAKAVNNRVLVYNAARPEQVSDTFGVLEYAPDAPVSVLRREMVVENTDTIAHTYLLSYTASTEVPGVAYSLPESVTVPPGGRTTFTVTLTVDPAALAKTAEATANTTQRSTGEDGQVVAFGARQYVTSASGQVVLTEGDTTLRVPVHAAPKLVSQMRVATAEVQFERGQQRAQLPLSGTGVDQGGYRSLLGAFELGVTSGHIPTEDLSVSSDQRADIQYAGAASDAAALAAAGKNPNDGSLYFGISTWGNWSEVTPRSTYYVFIDTDGDGTNDYRLHTMRAAGVDYPLVQLSRADNGRWVPVDGALYPLNNTWGSTDTNTMDSNTLIMGVPLRQLGLSTQNPGALSYTVATTSSYATTPIVDATEAVKFNPFTPAFWFTGTASGVPGLFVDAPNASLTVHRTEGAEGKLLLLHLHNSTGNLNGALGATGDRAQVLNVSGENTHNTVRARFTDVSDANTATPDIDWLAERRITRGYPGGTFHPGEDTERGAAAAFFYRLAGSPAYTPPQQSPFTDVPTNHPFYKEIAWMHQAGITTGWADGTFRPHEAATREAMAAFFYRAAGSPAYTPPEKSPFEDVPTSARFYREITWAYEKKIFTEETSLLKPAATVRREAAATMIHRYARQVLHRG